MLPLIIAYIATAVVFLIVDFLWLGLVARTFYRDQLAAAVTVRIRLGWALVFYALFIGGIVFFGVRPGLEASNGETAFVRGSLFGFFCYATYNLTNLATVARWPLRMSLIDIAWGAALSGICAFAGYGAARLVVF